MNNARKLAKLIDRESDSLLTRWRDQVRQLPSGSTLDVPALNDHIPDLLAEIAAALSRMEDETIVDARVEKSPPVPRMKSPRSQAGISVPLDLKQG